MKMKKVMALGMAMAMALSLSACGGSSSEATVSEAPASEAPASEAASSAAESAVSSAPEASETAVSSAAAADGQTYTVGICQLVQHPALDAATQGFQDALTEKLGDSVTIDLQNASGDTPTCSTIVNKFVSDGVDLILANATAPLQAAQAATDTIPIIGTSVTDYGTALQIDDWSGASGVNISGTTDLAPLEDQAAMIKELCPDAEKVGILYCSAEANSVYQAEEIRADLIELGYADENITDYTFADSNDIASVVTNAAADVQVVYIPTDNTAASNTEIINNILEPAGIPVIAGEEGICEGCGVATLSISYYDLGFKAGEMAYDVLVNGADISTMQVESAGVTKKYMADRAEALGIAIPDDYEAITSEEETEASEETEAAEETTEAAEEEVVETEE